MNKLKLRNRQGKGKMLANKGYTIDDGRGNVTENVDSSVGYGADFDGKNFKFGGKAELKIEDIANIANRTGLSIEDASELSAYAAYDDKSFNASAKAKAQGKNRQGRASVGYGNKRASGKVFAEYDNYEDPNASAVYGVNGKVNLNNETS